MRYLPWIRLRWRAAARALRVEAVRRHLVPEQDGVVVALLAVALELLRAVEQHGDPGDAVVAQEGDADALPVVPREFVPGHQPEYLGAVTDGIHPADLAQSAVAAHGLHLLGW